MRDRKSHGSNPARGCPEHMGFGNLQSVKHPGEITHKRSAIVLRTAFRPVVSPSGVGDHSEAAGSEHGLLVEPDLTALRAGMAKDKRFAGAACVAIPEPHPINGDVSLPG